jgi:hypothetical protein
MNKQTRIDFALRTPELFETTKLLVRKTGDKFVVTKDTDKLYFDTLVHGIYQKKEKFNLDFLIAVLNSNPATTFYRLLHDIKGKVFAKISLDKLSSFPLPEGTTEQRNELANLANKMNELKSDYMLILSSLRDYLQSKYSLDKVSKKLQVWHELEFSDFLKELKKAKVKLTLSEEAEWMAYFNEQKQKALALKSEIDKTDREIDRMVYELYGLTEEEIGVVEGN